MNGDLAAVIAAVALVAAVPWLIWLRRRRERAGYEGARLCRDPRCRAKSYHPPAPDVDKHGDQAIAMVTYGPDAADFGTWAAELDSTRRNR